MRKLRRKVPGPPLPDKLKKKLNSLPKMLTTTKLQQLKNKHSRKMIRNKRRWRSKMILDSRNQASKIPSGTTLSFQSLRKQQRPQSPHNNRIRNGRAIIIPCNSRNKTKLLLDEKLFLLTSGARRYHRRQKSSQLDLQILRCAIVVTTG